MADKKELRNYKPASALSCSLKGFQRRCARELTDY